MNTFPGKYLPDKPRSLWGRQGRQPNFWVNFHYTSDPVSGRLDEFRDQGKSLVMNMHPKGIRIPGFSHLAYWRDKSLLARALYLTFNPYVNKKPLKVRSDVSQSLGLLFGAVFWAIAVTLTAVALIWWVGEQWGLWDFLQRA